MSIFTPETRASMMLYAVKEAKTADYVSEGRVSLARVQKEGQPTYYLLNGERVEASKLTTKLVLSAIKADRQ